MTTGCGSGSAGEATPDAAGITDAAGPPARALVGIGRGTGVSGSADMARSSLQLALAHTTGGLSFVAPGDNVFVKVNLNSGVPFPYTTSVHTLTALIEALWQRGAGHVACGDRSFFGADSAANADASGIRAAVEAAGAEWLIFDENDAGFGWLQIPEQQVPAWSGGIRIPAVFSTADHIIHMPVLKTHVIAHYTMTVKLGFGAIHADDRRNNLSPHIVSGGHLWQQIAQVGASYTPSLHILDAQQPVITEGPNRGDTVPGFDLMIASSDAIATDVTGLAVLAHVGSPEPQITGYGPWTQPQLVECINAGLGIDAPEAYTIAGTGADTELTAIRDLTGA